jgi:hypothetical protein
MALSQKFINTAVFIAGAKDVGPPSDASLQGTGFIVQMPASDPDKCFLYVVTAAHVVRSFNSTFVRVSRKDGSVMDLHVPRGDWVFHWREDIAVALVTLMPSEVSVTVIPTESFVGVAETQFAPGPGDEVFFAGLLGLVPSMARRNIPMVRGGMIGALGQGDIPVRIPDGTVLNMHGHLIDCRSFGGFSGSPCFVNFLMRIDHTPNVGLAMEKRGALLLGLVSGHFDLRASVALPDETGDLGVPVAAGIAVLSTSQSIYELLMDDDLVAARLAAAE